MAKPRIIIADTDIDYMIPLQWKFVKEFYEKIDLEIISDRDYFHSLFSTPQKVDVLIISESLYDLTIHRHNIAHVFLLTEQQEDDVTGQLNVDRILKYTGVLKIFNEVVGKSPEIWKIDIEKKEPQIVVVYSACGGTGKTTVALGISECLTQSYKKVLYINASHLQCFQRILKNPTPISSMDVYAKLASASDNIYFDIKHVIRQEHFSYLPPFKAALMSLGVDYGSYKKIAISAKKSKDYDFIIIDADATFDEDKAALLSCADKVIMVTDQSASSVYSTNILISNINGMTDDKYMFVCNDFNNDKDNAIIAPNINTKFSINEYIEHFRDYDQMNCEMLAKDSGMQRTAFLVM